MANTDAIKDMFKKLTLDIEKINNDNVFNTLKEEYLKFMKKYATTKLTQTLRRYLTKKMKKDNVNRETIRKIINTINVTNLFYSSIDDKTRMVRFSLSICHMEISGDYCGRVGELAQDPLDARMSIEFSDRNTECIYKCNFYDMAHSDFWEIDVCVALSNISYELEIDMKNDYIVELCEYCLNGLLYKNLKNFNFMEDM